MIVYGRKHSYRLYCKLLNEATRWANAIQNVIDTKAAIDTPTQQLIQDIKVSEPRSATPAETCSEAASGQLQVPPGAERGRRLASIDSMGILPKVLRNKIQSRSVCLYTGMLAFAKNEPF